MKIFRKTTGQNRLTNSLVFRLSRKIGLFPFDGQGKFNGQSAILFSLNILGLSLATLAVRIWDLSYGEPVSLEQLLNHLQHIVILLLELFHFYAYIKFRSNFESIISECRNFSIVCDNLAVTCVLLLFLSSLHVVCFMGSYTTPRAQLISLLFFLARQNIFVMTLHFKYFLDSSTARMRTLAIHVKRSSTTQQFHQLLMKCYNISNNAEMISSIFGRPILCTCGNALISVVFHMYYFHRSLILGNCRFGVAMSYCLGAPVMVFRDLLTLILIAAGCHNFNKSVSEFTIVSELVS